MLHLGSQRNRRVTLSLRQLRQGVVLVRASNDTLVDEYDTTITVEQLRHGPVKQESQRL